MAYGLVPRRRASHGIPFPAQLPASRRSLRFVADFVFSLQPPGSSQQIVSKALKLRSEGLVNHQPAHLRLLFDPLDQLVNKPLSFELREKTTTGVTAPALPYRRCSLSVKSSTR